jgi:CubicO group peptidase (beta-lactamase class C family)
VTLDRLLTHRAGVTPNPGLMTILGSLFLPISPMQERRDVCRLLLRKPTERPPGKDFLYSNAGYIIAGAMAEVAAGEPWEDLIRHRLFEPLQMRSAGFGAPGAETTSLQTKGTPSQITQPCGHTETGQSLPASRFADNAENFGPAGRVHLSLRDWATYASLHLAGSRGLAFIPRGKSKPLLTTESLRHLQTPQGGAIGKLNGGYGYAMGWMVQDDPKTRARSLQHFGSNTFWMAAIAIHPDRNTAVLVATNQGGEAAAKACNEILEKLAHLDSGRLAGASR